MQPRPPKTSSSPAVPTGPFARCPCCSSRLLQLEAWRELPRGGMTLRVRCPECEARCEGDFDAGQVAIFDEEIAQARLELRALHDAIVRENIEREATVLSRALELDLIGPEDFGLQDR
jgi:hypothetical protein